MSITHRTSKLAAALLTTAGALVSCSVSSAPGTEEERAENVKESPDVSSSQETPPAHTNRLISETSPYLLQHAHNPVDWYPWGPEAFRLAKEESKPIFLSVGYSACHWCHVMERESFESEEIAAILNAHFISIKVDREERPDVDEIYMAAVQAMTGSGGWPMSVFLTPDLKPFYGGTYFPPQDAYGRPGFKTLLNRIAEVWADKRDEVLANADRLSDHMQQALTLDETPGSLNEGILSNAVAALRQGFDSDFGGFGPAPKFPSSPSVELLLRDHQRRGDASTLEMAVTTLDRMSQGGMYDHLGGGFARYSTDVEWLVPHFEKMLYDNAQLAQVYLEGYQVTKKASYRRVAEEILEYVLRDMKSEAGGLYSAEDADSEGEEGKFYVWTHDEIVAVVGPDDAAVFSAYYGVMPGGNFDSHETYHQGQNILHTTRPADEIAVGLSMDIEAFHTAIEAMRIKLLAVRNERVRPGLDDKILTSWNALMISAFARGHQILGDPRYKDAAEQVSHFILDEMRSDNGRLLRTHRNGESRLPAYLDDYAYMIVALIDVYETTFDVQWLREADALVKVMIFDFWDEETSGFYFTSADHKNLLVRTKSTQDNAMPSGNAMAALGMLRLSKLLDNADYYQRAKAILEANHRYLAEAPRAVMKLLCVADAYLHPPKEIAIVGSLDDERTAELLRSVHEHFIPNKILALTDPSDDARDTVADVVPLLKDKTLVSGEPAAYVCKDFACQQPVTAPRELQEQLGVL